MIFTRSYPPSLFLLVHSILHLYAWNRTAANDHGVSRCSNRIWVFHYIHAQIRDVRAVRSEQRLLAYALRNASVSRFLLMPEGPMQCIRLMQCRTLPIIPYPDTRIALFPSISLPAPGLAMTGDRLVPYTCVKARHLPRLSRVLGSMKCCQGR